MIEIRHLSGGLAGKTQSFPDSKETIEFGREADCDVVYPPEETLVGRRHMALTRALDDWTVHIHEGARGPHFVSVDSTPVETEAQVRPGGLIRLGRDDGPSLTFQYEPKTLGGGVGETQTQEEVTPAATRTRRLATVGGALAVVFALALAGWVEWSGKRQRDMATTIASLTQDQKNEKDVLARINLSAGGAISQDIIDRARAATFLVVKEDAEGRRFGVGTAWVIGSDLLATNAHIAGLCDAKFPAEARKFVECDDLKPGEKLLVLQPGANGASYPVTQHLFHPGYTAFPQFVFGQDPAFVPSFRGDQPSEIEGYGYDIGLLRIEGQLPPDLVMMLASKEELLALKPGAPLASAGYPYENVSGDTVIAVAATPQVHYGNVTALTDFLFLPTDPAYSYLVQHSIPETGGGSGSLIVASSGHVVAINNAGNFGPRGEWSARGAPSGVEINYAQRADLIADLVGGQAQAAYDADKPYWTTQLAKFQRGYEVIGQWVLESARPDAKSTADLVSETAGLMTGDDMRVDPDTHKKQRVKVDTFNLTAGTSYFVLAYADRETPIAIYLKDANNQTQVNNTNSHWYPSVSFKPAASGPFSLVVTAPDADVSYKIKLYAWRPDTH